LADKDLPFLICQKMLQSMKGVFIWICLWCTLDVFAQVLTEAEAIRLTLGTHPAMQIAGFEVAKSKALEKTAFNPEQPRFSIETPTDAGIGFEVEQDFDFPTVYTRRKSWLKDRTALALEETVLTRASLKRDVRLFYLDAQILQAEYHFLEAQDSLWKAILDNSIRLYDAGEINKADLIFSERQAGLANITLQNARLNLGNQLSVLRMYTGQSFSSVESPEPLSFDTSELNAGFHFDAYLMQSIEVAESESQLSRAHRMPGLTIGYLKATEPDTEFRYRYKAGITVPIWQGQYTGEVNAAKSEIEKVKAEAALKQRETNVEYRQEVNTLTQSSRNLEWFERNALPQSNQLVDIYYRLYQAGEIDYAVALRSIADAGNIYTQYLETLKLHNQSVIQLDYLKGDQ
jgi:outer membrane protein TolC